MDASVSFEIYHSGFVVSDIASAMAELTTTLGYDWLDVVTRRLRFRGPEAEQSVELTFTYTRRGPHRLELLQEVPGTIWETRDGLATPHHVGMWVEDVAAESARLAADGSPLLWTYAGDPDRAVGFAYHRLPCGLMVELVDTSRREAFDAWFGGDRFSAPLSARA